MSQHIDKYCDRCDENTKHRRVIDKRNDKEYVHYTCSVCRENDSKKHRKRFWLRYLAQKANARKRPNSEIMTEEILQDILNKQEGRCELTGMEFQGDGDWMASLDRIDSSIGYRADNVRLTSWIVNHCRGDLSDWDFINVCRLVADYSRMDQ